jgi:hypothetical protein
VYPSCSIIQENIILNRAKDWFSLEVLTLMGGVGLDIGTWESSFPFWASDRVGSRRLSNEAQPDSTRCCVTHSQKEKLQERPRSFPPSNCPDILLYPWSMRHLSFLCFPPPFVNLRMRFLLREEGCNTLYYKVLKPFIRVLIKHSIKWLILF